MDKNNSSTSQGLVLTVQDLEAVVSNSRISSSQLAQLYGFTEKLLLTKIDNMQIYVDGGDETDPALRILRKDLVGRCNALMDSLEKRKDRAVDTRAVNTVAAGVSVGEDDFMQLAAMLTDGTVLHTAASSSAGDAVADDVSGVYHPPVSHLVCSGFLSSLASACVVARHDPTPYVRICAQEEERRSGRRLRSVHTHSAAAAFVGSSLLRSAGCHLFLSFSAYAVHISVIRITPSVDEAPVLVDYIVYRQHPVTSKGAQKNIAASANSTIPLITAAVNEAGTDSIETIVVASSGPRTKAMFALIRFALDEAYLGVPILFPGVMKADQDGCSIPSDFVALGAALLAAADLRPADTPISIRILNEPIACIVGVRTRVMAAASYYPSHSDSEASEDLNSLMTVMPICTPSELICSDGIYIDKTLDLACHSVFDAVSNQDRNAECSCPPAQLFLELVQVEIGGTAGGISAAGWKEGTLQMAVPRKAAPVVAKLAGLSMVSPIATTERFLTGGVLSSTRGSLRYRVISRHPVEQVFEENRISNAVELLYLQHVQVVMQLDIDRNIKIGLLSIPLGSPAVGIPLLTRCDVTNCIYHLPPSNSLDPPTRFLMYLTNTKEADKLKTLGNDELKAASGGHEFSCTQKAILQYSLALQWDPLNAVLYSNRCAARLKLCALQRMRMDPTLYVDGWLSEALTDAEICVRLRPTWSKGQSRLGEVLFRQNRLEASVDAYNRAYICEKDEQKEISGSSSATSSILKSLNEVKGAWDLQVATKAAQEAERILRNEVGDQDGSAGKKKKRKAESGESGSSCTLS